MGILKKAKKKLKKVAKKVGQVAQKAAPYVGLVPGVGTIAGTALGAGGSALSGDSLKTILKSGVKGGLSGYLGGQVGGLPGIIGGFTGAGGGLANIGLGGLSNIANAGLPGGLGAWGQAAQIGGGLLGGGQGQMPGTGGNAGSGSGGGFDWSSLIAPAAGGAAGLYALDKLYDKYKDSGKETPPPAPAQLSDAAKTYEAQRDFRNRPQANVADAELSFSEWDALRRNPQSSGGAAAQGKIDAVTRALMPQPQATPAPPVAAPTITPPPVGQEQPFLLAAPTPAASKPLPVGASPLDRRLSGGSPVSSQVKSRMIARNPSFARFARR